jgi:hypothetical protein
VPRVAASARTRHHLEITRRAAGAATSTRRARRQPDRPDRHVTTITMSFFALAHGYSILGSVIVRYLLQHGPHLSRLPK